MKKAFLMLVLVLFSTNSFAQNLTLVDVRNRAQTVIANCPIVAGVNTDKIVILNGGRSIGLPKAFKRQNYDLAKRFRYWACHPEIGLFAAPAGNPSAVEGPFKFEASDFPVGESTTPGSGALKCSQVQNVSSQRNILYKESNLHGGRGRTFLDQDRRLGGVRKLIVTGMNGTPIACFGLYACDFPYGCRYYQAMCGDNQSNFQVASKARQNGGTSNVLVGTGNGGLCFSFDSSAARVGSVRK